jgi:hypothetical protein
MACDRGQIEFALALSPEAKPRLQTLLWDSSLPPSPLLQRAADTVVPWLARWDETARASLAPNVNVEATRKTLTVLATTHGPCKMDQPLLSDGATKAKFLLSCQGGPLELTVSVDPKTERITAVGAKAPRTQANCAP